MTYKSSFESLQIQLEHDIDEQYQYQPGEIIRGKICIHLHRSTLVQQIYVSIFGEGVVSWDDPYLGTFQASENYLDSSKVILDRTQQTPELLDRGFHDLPFEYQLPEDIPSSFIGKYGSVTYILKAVVQGERTGDTSIATEPFLVLRGYLLPERVYKPIERKLEKRYWSLCSTGKVKVVLGLNQTGFVPGEDLYIQAEIQNHSPLRITAIQASVIMNSEYFAQKDSIPFRQIVNKRRDDYELIDGDGRLWQNVRIAIPPYIPESNLEFCDIINVAYTFQFRVELSGGQELRTEIPILLGAKPKGLEVPADKLNNINTHWTMGPKDLARNGVPEFNGIDQRHESWDVGAPEFRQDTEVKNPLYRLDSQHKKSKHGHKHDHFDNLEEKHHNTRM